MDVLKGRLIVSVVTTMMEEAAIAAAVLVGLPMLDIHLPLYALVVIMGAWLALSVFTHRVGTRALKRKPVIDLPITGSEGKVVKPLDPEGMVMIRGELWTARAESRKINTAAEVTVVAQDGLKLVVRRSGSVRAKRANSGRRLPGPIKEGDH